MDAVTLLTLFAVFLFVSPSRFVLPGLGGAGTPAVIIGIGCFVGWVLARVAHKAARPGPQPVRWLVLPFVLVSVLGYAVAYSRGVTKQEATSADRTLLITLAMVGLALATADGVPNRRRLDQLLVRMAWLAAFMGVVGALQFVAGMDIVPKLKLPGLTQNSVLVPVGHRGNDSGAAFSRVPGTALHYIEFGVVLSMMLPIALHYALYCEKGRKRQLRFALCAFLAMCVPFAVSRAATLGLIIVVVTMAAVWTRPLRHKALVVAVIGAGLFKAAFPGLLGTLRSLFLNASNDPSVTGRTSDYSVASTYINERPLVGRGLGTFIPEQYIFLDNQYLKQLIETGYPGVVILVGFFAGAILLARWVRKHAIDNETRHLGQALAASLIAGAVTSATFDSFSFGIFTGVLFVLIGAAGALWRFSVVEPQVRESYGTVDALAPLHWVARVLPDDVRLPRPAAAAVSSEPRG